jgi:isoamylase
MELAQCISRFLCTPIPKLNPLPRFLSTNLPNQSKTAPTKKPWSLIVNARQGGGGGAEAETATSVAVKETPQLGRFHVSRGYPTPFGATFRDGGVNFAIYSANAVSTTLCLITLSDLHHVSHSLSSTLQFGFRTLNLSVSFCDKNATPFNQ